ncbi:MAG TPA: hypothetical protein GXZ35_05290 [Acholeplasmataceae bacterium]|nr:hypothetical protein [Acholeplasmataceae bacterium]
MKKFLFILFAFLGAILIYFILTTYVMMDASSSLSNSFLKKGNETGDYLDYLQLSYDYNKKIDNDSIPSNVKLYQTVNYDYDNKIYIYRYFVFISDLKQESIIDDPENTNKIPHIKVFLITEGEDEMIYYSAEDEKVVGTEEAPELEFDWENLNYIYFSFVIKRNSDYRIDLLTNSGNVYKTMSFTHQGSDRTETMTREEYKELFDQIEGYTKKFDSDLFYNYLNKHMKSYIVWLGMGFYLLFMVGLYYLFFGKARVKFKKKNVDFE